MEKTLFTGQDLEAACRKRVKTDTVLYLACTVLCLALSIVFMTALPAVRLLYLVFFAVTLFFAVLTGSALWQKSAVRGGRYRLYRARVIKKHEKGICDAGANYLVFEMTEEPGKKLTVAELTLEEFREASKDREYYIAVRRSLRPKVLCILPADEFEPAPELREKMVK